MPYRTQGQTLPGTDKFLHTIKLGAGCLMLFPQKEKDALCFLK
jgi:hypothetical protein